MIDYEQLRAAVDAKLSTDPEFRTIMKRISSGRATFIDTARYSQVLSHILGSEVSKKILDVDGREAVVSHLLHDSYEDINDVFGRVQTNIDKKKGLNIKPRQGEYPGERIEQFVHSLVDPTVEDSVIKRRARAGTETITKSFHDDCVAENAKLHEEAGLKTYIIRMGTDCCQWCSDVAGKYEMKDQPQGIFRRHDNCDCTVIYDGQVLRGQAGDNGKRSKKWVEVPKNAGAAEPVRLNKEQAKKLEQEKLKINKSSIDNPVKSGIIKENSKQKPVTEITDKAIENVPKVNISGYTDEQCGIIQKQHKELLEYSQKHNNNNEVAFVFDSSLENRKEFIGSDDKIDFGRGFYGNEMTVLHNHPRNGSYSITDIIFFGDNTNVKTLTIVKNNGKVEYLTKGEAYNPEVFKLEFDRLYRKIIKNGTDSEKDKFVKTFLNKTKSGVIWSERA